MTSCHFYCILNLRNISISPAHTQGLRGRIIQSHEGQRQKPLESILEATDHNFIKISLFQLHKKKLLKESLRHSGELLLITLLIAKNIM